MWRQLTSSAVQTVEWCHLRSQPYGVLLASTAMAKEIKPACRKHRPKQPSDQFEMETRRNFQLAGRISFFGLDCMCSNVLQQPIPKTEEIPCKGFRSEWYFV
eukprot:scpid106949/ scgid30961/ 